MSVSFHFIGPNPRAGDLDDAAISFIQFATGIVNGSACVLQNDAGVLRLPGARSAVAQHTNGRQTLIASTTDAEFHAEEALLDLMKRCRWGDFRYMYVEFEPCQGGDCSRPKGSGCKDKLSAALPASAGIVFYSRARPG